MKSGEATTITVADTKATDSKGKATTGAPVVVATTKAKKHVKGGWKKGIAIFDFILRLLAIATTLAAAAAMGTTDQTLPLVTKYYQFRASYEDFSALTFFVIANAIACGDLVLSLPFSIVTIIRPHVVGARLLLVIFDTVMVALTAASAAAAAAIVYLAHDGNPTANWLAMCQQFNDFCQQISGAVVASSVATLIFMLLVVMSALSLRKP